MNTVFDLIQRWQRKAASIKSMRTVAGALAAAALSLPGCENRERAATDPYYFLQPQLPVVTPMKLDRAGAKYSMNFWVLPEQPSQRIRPFFIGFRSLLPLDTATATLIDVGEVLQYGDIPLEVQLTQLDALAEKKIQLLGPPELIDGDLKYTPLINDQAPIRRAVDADNDLLIAKKLLDLSKRDEYLQFAVVRTIAPGYYRLDVRVLKDNPKTSTIDTELIVSNHYKGK
jgi:hypothetical protein